MKYVLLNRHVGTSVSTGKSMLLTSARRCKQTGSDVELWKRLLTVPKTNLFFF